MRNTFAHGAAVLVICSILGSTALADQRQAIYALGLELERQTSALAQESFDHFRGWNNTILDEEQAVLFNSEAFLVEVAEATLDKMEEGEVIDLTFEGRLIIEQGSRPNRSVCLIEAGKKRE